MESQFCLVSVLQIVSVGKVIGPVSNRICPAKKQGKDNVTDIVERCVWILW